MLSIQILANSATETIMSQTHANVAMQFDDADQQRSAATFGMWVFLTTEVLFFGGMFVAYAVYRSQFPDAFELAGRHVNLWAGGVMTAVLLTGSLLVAMSDHADRTQRSWRRPRS